MNIRSIICPFIINKRIFSSVCHYQRICLKKRKYGQRAIQLHRIFRLKNTSIKLQQNLTLYIRSWMRRRREAHRSQELSLEKHKKTRPIFTRNYWRDTLTKMLHNASQAMHSYNRLSRERLLVGVIGKKGNECEYMKMKK